MLLCDLTQVFAPFDAMFDKEGLASGMTKALMLKASCPAAGAGSSAGGAKEDTDSGRAAGAAEAPLLKMAGEGSDEGSRVMSACP